MKYKVVGYDSFSHEDWEVGQYKNKDDAINAAKERAGTMTLMYVYEGDNRIASFGSY